MTCILPDGTITNTARNVLSAAMNGADEKGIAETTGLPVFRVRSAIREMVEAKLLDEKENRYKTTDMGKGRI